ncbi:MAG TPA: preprotein translocase subunit SecA [bacterium]|nr:preprotein translocase subunit SecA [bacterium]
MLQTIYRVIFGDPNEKILARYRRTLESIIAQEEHYAQTIRTVDDVRAETNRLRGRFTELADIADRDLRKKRRKELVDSVIVEAFALHRTACRIIAGQSFEIPGRDTPFVWNMVPFDVQILGALALNDGNIAEMRTGEGKTLVATIAAYANALAGESVHVVTVNDYLARRDASEMGIIYQTLGLSVGIVTHSERLPQKKEAYAKDVVYVTNNELGFDYLRDNMAPKREFQVLGNLSYAIVDEVDSILVDEARTPLIISAPDEEPTTKYVKFAALAKQLQVGTHYKLDEKHKNVILLEDGIRELERVLGIENIFVSDHYNDIHHIENALKASYAYKLDVDYLVRDGEVMIIDEHTGRVLSGRRYSDGLHQAIEAKEAVEIKQESKTLASITFQNLFRLYDKLAGMTGTAKTEEEEFFRIYGLEVVVVPTNRSIARIDRGDLLFKNEKGKFEFLGKLIKAAHEAGQPVLVGTVSVAKSEYLSGLLSRAGVPHEVLNAKQDAREAEIIGRAGLTGAVTIATNMAGRGTDIKIDDHVRSLSGSITVAGNEFPLGGLWVIGTEKHETRRIDNQLRGRSGRQGDPGMSQFMVSPTDDIMRIFGGDKLFGIFNSFTSLPDDEPLAESRMLTRRIDSVQKQVEGRNFDIRKHILEFDDVLNQHRLIIYARRRRFLESDSIHEEILSAAKGEITTIVDVEIESPHPDEWDLVSLVNTLREFAGTDLVGTEELAPYGSKEELIAHVFANFETRIATLSSVFGEERFRIFEKGLALQSTDILWMGHIERMSGLRQEVAFEGYAQKNPLLVYKDRAYSIFVDLLREINFKVVR